MAGVLTGLASARQLRKELLLAYCFLAGLPAVWTRLGGIGGLAGKAAYLVLCLALTIALVAASHVSRGWLRWSLAVVLSASAFFLTAYTQVTTQFLTYDAFINLLNSAAFAGDALAQNRAALLASLPPCLILLLALGLAPRRALPRYPNWMPAAMPLAGCGVLAGVLFVRGGDGALGLPSSFPPLAYSALAAYEAASGEVGPRQAVSLPLVARPAARNIVLVVDESIAGAYLDINSPLGVPTPLSRSWPGLTIANMGIAASINNCSVGSNVTLRYGGTREDYRRIIATGPSVWAYARKAGLRTVYIDAQRTGGALQNLMSAEERAQIDRFVQFDTVPVLQRDQAVARELIAQLADPAPKFILVNKMGAHFPVQDKYPDAWMRYRPVLERGHFGDISDTGNREGFSGTLRDWAHYRNAYRNTLLWNVGVFFETLLRDGDLSRTTLIYTSDHGQDLHERGNPGTYTHCSADPAMEEGAVPLVVVDGAHGSGIARDGRLDVQRGHASHYMIFPSLLGMMGYDPARVASTYGPALGNGAGEALPTFNALFNARLNRKPVWVGVAADRLLQPPMKDVRGHLPLASR